MALTDEGTNTTMLVQPSYGGMNNGGFGFGGDWAWIILLLLAFGGGWGNGFGGGFGGMDGLYPWLNNSQNINGGFRDQFLNTQIGDLRTDVNRGFGDIQLGIAGVNQNICQTGNGIVAALNNGFSGAEIAANNRQMANMQQIYGLQSQLAQCCCDNRLATAQTQALVQSENCADRYEAAQNTMAIINAITGGIQSIKDDLCADRLDAERRENQNLRTQLSMAQLAASQDVQTAAIQAGQRALANEVEQYVAPRAIPAYQVQNPSCCYNPCGCGVM